MKYFSLLIFCIGLVLPTQGQYDKNLGVFSIPKDLMEEAGAVVRYEKQELNIKSKELTEMKVHKIVTVFEADSPYEDLVIGYDRKSSPVSKIKVVIYDALGAEVRKFGKKDIIDRSSYDGMTLYSDNRYKHIDCKHNKFPYTIEYSYEQLKKKTFIYENWFVIDDYNVAVEEAVYTVTMPLNFAYKSKVLNTDINPVETTNETSKTVTWKFKNIAAYESEPYSPGFYEKTPAVFFVPEAFNFGGYEGKMDTWKAYGQFYEKLNKNANNLSPEMKAEIKEMTAEASSDKEKIEILYSYLQDNMRYVGIQLGVGGWKAFDAAYVEENKYGDCKALTYFMKSMLEEVDVAANPVLIYAGRQRVEVNKDFTIPLFNHILLNIPSEDCWLECTSKSATPFYITSNNANRNALMITDQGGELIRTPKLGGMDNAQVSNTKIVLTEKGEASIKNQIKYTGSDQDYYRYYKNNYSQKELEEDFQEDANLPNFTIVNFEVSPQAAEPATMMDYELTVPRYAAKAGKRIFVPLNLLSTFDRIPPAEEGRETSVRVKNSYIEIDTVQFTLPSGYEVESMPNEDLIIESVFGTYKVQVSQSDNELIYSRFLEIKEVNLPGAEYENLRAFYKQITKADKQKLVLVEKKT